MHLTWVLHWRDKTQNVWLSKPTVIMFRGNLNLSGVYLRAIVSEDSVLKGLVHRPSCPWTHCKTQQFENSVDFR